MKLRHPFRPFPSVSHTIQPIPVALRHNLKSGVELQRHIGCRLISTDARVPPVVEIVLVACADIAGIVLAPFFAVPALEAAGLVVGG